MWLWQPTEGLDANHYLLGLTTLTGTSLLTTVTLGICYSSFVIFSSEGLILTIHCPISASVTHGYRMGTLALLEPVSRSPRSQFSSSSSGRLFRRSSLSGGLFTSLMPLTR